MRIETVINATVIRTAAPRLPNTEELGDHGYKKTRRAGTRLRIRDMHSNNEQNRRALSLRFGSHNGSHVTNQEIEQET